MNTHSLLLIDAVLSIGVLLIMLAVTLTIGELDWHPLASVGFSVGMALLWPVVVAVVITLALAALAASLGATLLWMPVALIRGKPLVEVKKS